jgi:hypothetical protein
MFAVISRKSIAVDEIVMIPSAYYHLAAGFQLVGEHPPLAKIIAGVPTLRPAELKPEQIAGEPGRSPKSGVRGKVWGEQSRPLRIAFVLATRPGHHAHSSLGLLIFKFARELFGPLAAVLAVALFTRAHGPGPRPRDRQTFPRLSVTYCFSSRCTVTRRARL